MDKWQPPKKNITVFVLYGPRGEKIVKRPPMGFGKPEAKKK